MQIATVWLAFTLAGPSDFPISSGDTVVFIGDSITQAGQYVAFVEGYLATQFGGAYCRIVNLGLSSETASGTSEPEHPGKRPCIHDRFARDVVPQKPQIVLACYGMNDGNYFPFDEDRFAKYKAGIERLVKRVFEETPARKLVLLTPPPFDAYRRQVGDPNSKTYGYRFPAVDYDDVLIKYGTWLKTLASDRVQVVDVHAVVAGHLAEERKTNASYHVAGDAVHPNAVGHWLMAQAILRSWKLHPAGEGEHRLPPPRSGQLPAGLWPREKLDGDLFQLPVPASPATQKAADEVQALVDDRRLRISGAWLHVIHGRKNCTAADVVAAIAAAERETERQRLEIVHRTAPMPMPPTRAPK